MTSSLLIRMSLAVVLLATAVLMFPSMAMAEGPPSFDEMAQSLVCQCGCGLTIGNCSHPTCGPRDTMVAQVRYMINQELSGPQITQAFVAQYGEKVLAAPTKQGFNLVAWVTPFAAVVVGAIAIFFFLKAWVLKAAQPAPSPLAATPQEENKYRQRLDEELRRFTGGPG